MKRKIALMMMIPIFTISSLFMVSYIYWNIPYSYTKQKGFISMVVVDKKVKPINRIELNSYELNMVETININLNSNSNSYLSYSGFKYNSEKKEYNLSNSDNDSMWIYGRFDYTIENNIMNINQAEMPKDANGERLFVSMFSSNNFNCDGDDFYDNRELNNYCDDYNTDSSGGQISDNIIINIKNGSNNG